MKGDGAKRDGVNDDSAIEAGDLSPEQHEQRVAGELADIDVAAIADEEALAAQRTAAIDAGRKRGGAVGAAMAGAMMAIRDIYDGRKKKDPAPIQQASPTDPPDLDTKGIEMRIGDVDLWAPPVSRNEDPPDNGARL